MRARLGVLALALAGWTLTVGAQAAEDIDAVVASPDRFRVLLDNAQVRVVEYTLRPGERDQWHTHPPKVSYVARGGKLRIHLADGTSFVSDEAQGTAVWMDALPRHYAENIGPTDVTMVLTEVKSMATTAAADKDAIVDAMRTMYVALVKDDAALFRSSTAPGFFTYDGGKRFTGDELLALIKSRHDEGVVYVWNITEPDVHVDGRTAWMTYVNRGSVTDAAGKKDVVWLESAVLRKDAGNWRIQFFHSTRMP